MRSRQVNFFLTQADQADLLRAFEPLGELAFVAGRSQDRQPNFLDGANVRQMGAERLQIFLVRPQDVNEIVFTDLGTTTSVDVLRSPVIEFGRCYRDQRLLRRGRLYFVTSYYDDRGAIAGKPSAFIEWGGALLSKARKTLTKDASSFFYFGSEALKLREAGIEMAQS